MTSISILMPVFNSSNYLKYSIESVIRQTFTDWELMCIDDGSSDNSYEILEKYSLLDSRIKVFKQENKGPLLARRLGFEFSCGNYIIYLDSDDQFSDDLLESLYFRALMTNADSVAPDMISRYDKIDISWNEVNKIDINKILNSQEAFEETFPWKGLHNFNLWKRKVFEMSTYHPYLDNNNFNADEILQRILLINCSTIVYSDKGKYIRYYNESSLTNTLQFRSFNRLDANIKLIAIATDHHMDKNVISKIYSFSFFCQLKTVMILYYSNNSMAYSECLIAMEKMKKAFYDYRSKKMNYFYGKSIVGLIKFYVQISSFRVFKIVCYLQSKFSKNVFGNTTN